MGMPRSPHPWWFLDLIKLIVEINRDSRKQANPQRAEERQGAERTMRTSKTLGPPAVKPGKTHFTVTKTPTGGAFLLKLLHTKPLETKKILTYG